MLMISVASLGSEGAWAWVALLAGIVSAAGLFLSLGRLGYFGSSERIHPAERVVSLDGRRRIREARHAAAGPHRSMNSNDQSARSM